MVYKNHLWSDFILSTDYHRLSQIFLISKDIVIITDYYHQPIIINQLSIIHNHPNQSLWLLICVNLCQSVVYKKPALTSRVYTLYSLKANQAIPIAQPSRAFF